MEPLKSKEENPNGLYRKYNITRTDGKPIPENAEFFILRLDAGAELSHMNASLKAMEVYAKEIKKEIPSLSDDIIKRHFNHISNPLEHLSQNEAFKEHMKRRDADIKNGK
jgi:hypothetical protein